MGRDNSDDSNKTKPYSRNGFGDLDSWLAWRTVLRDYKLGFSDRPPAGFSSVNFRLLTSEF
ncbi:MAG: hypothetical protein QNJ54_28415 [Prochloraceae cyanobacterium]|nr:hypothetical protein [Prochloraceae cyanobacterium]